MRYKEKNSNVIFFVKMGCAQERIANKKVKIHKKRTTHIIQSTKTSKNSILFLIKRNVNLKVKVAEDLI